MSHQVESLFYCGETPWHGLGKQLAHPPTSREAIIQAGLDWSVDLNPITVLGREYPDFLALTRNTDQRVYGIVKPGGYEVLQNSSAFEFFDPAITAGLADYETAGSLKFGERVWILVRLKGEAGEIADGDLVNRYLLLSNSHNGKNGIIVKFTPIRVVCNNTLQLAHQIETPFVRLVHSKKTQVHLETLRDAINFSNQKFDETFESYRTLAKYKLSDQKALEYFKKVFLNKNQQDKENVENTSRTLAKVIHLYHNDKTNNLPAIKNTVWSAYNAVTLFIDHFRSRSADNRVENAWFGLGNTTKQKAYDTALQLVA